MEIRSDFKDVAELLSRLIQYASAFRMNNVDRWPHLKNQEDFEKIFRLEWKERRHFERIYADGRDCAIALSEMLVAFNNPDQHPTLTSFVSSLEGGWIDQVGELEQISSDAKNAAKNIENCPWAVGQMISLFDDQIGLVKAASQTVELIKESRLYKIENGQPLTSPSDPAEGEHWWTNFDRRIAVIGLIVGLIGLAVTVL